LGNFTVYKSSAGSGKTFTLVKEYLKLALSDDRNPPVKYRTILAITFTNKAAAEMKERIVSGLEEISDPAGKGILIKKLKEETGLEEKTIRQRAATILQSILHNYSDFAVGTIDSFVHRIVRTFAFDLHLPVNFEIEMDSDKLLAQVIDLLISKAGTDSDITRALVEFTESKAEDEKSWHIEKELFEFSKNLLTEEGVLHLGKLKNIDTNGFLSIRNSLSKSIQQFESSIQHLASSALQLINNQGLELNAFYRGRSGTGAWFSSLSAGHFDKIEPNSYVKETYVKGKFYADKTDDSDKLKIDNIKDRLSEAFHSIETLLEKQQSLYYLFKLISKNIYSLAVLNEIEKLLTEIKKQKNCIHISEFNKIISRIVLNQPVPFIYERIGAKYLHYLIDEFQDTSVLQWQNMLPLIENSLSEGYTNMLVGDGKQAIYRWRGGEVEQFTQLPEIFLKEKSPFIAERERILKRNYNEQHLNNNYRSKKEIVGFNNSLFSFLEGKLIGNFRRIYNNLSQQADPENEGGYISLSFMEDNVEDEQQLTLDHIYETIRQLQAENYKLSDIAILCRTNKTGSIIAEFLTQKTIGVLSPDSLLLKNSRKVSFIGSLLKHLQQPGDDISKVEILQFLIESNSINGRLPDLIHTLKHKKTEGFDSLLKHYEFDFNHLQLLKLPLYEIVEQLIKIFHLGDSDFSSLIYFLDEVLGYSTKNNNNLFDFLNWWSIRKEKASMNVPVGANAVNIMTIHSSKGLEFPVVIFPFTGSTVTARGNLWVDLANQELPGLSSVFLPLGKGLEKTNYAHLYEEEKNKTLMDTVNLLYVALTRPEERLYIINSKPSKHPENLHSVTDMLCLYLQHLKVWSEFQKEYDFGSKTNHSDKNRKNTNSIRLNMLQSFDWRTFLKIRANAPEAEFGLIVHAVLAKIRIASDLNPVLSQFLKEGIIDLKEQEVLKTKIKRIIENKTLACYFREGVNLKIETEIILPNGERFRPDRVVLGPEATAIIDYKTGTKSDSHIKQIHNYGDLLAQMGYKNVEKYLVYVEDEIVIKV